MQSSRKRMTSWRPWKQRLRSKSRARRASSESLALFFICQRLAGADYADRNSMSGEQAGAKSDAFCPLGGGDKR